MSVRRRSAVDKYSAAASAAKVTAARNESAGIERVIQDVA